MGTQTTVRTPDQGLTAEQRGIITNIQRFSLHDGPGVRSTVFFKGCPLRCLWCHNPETYTFQPALSHDAVKCTGCGGCTTACPNGALTAAENGLRYDAALCRHCFACVRECPTGALSVLGKEITVDEVLREVLPDKGMYGRTGGGVTLSGGEPAAQPAFALALIKALHRQGIPAALDTCGSADNGAFLSLCREADLVLFDLKHADATGYKRLTGGDFSVIKHNFLALAKERPPVQVRIPVIPGLNDADGTLDEIAALINQNPRVESTLMLGYHPLGKAKAIGLNEARPSLSLAPPGRERLAELAGRMAARSGRPCTFR